MKASSPLLGFNNNVRHKGRVFHIQTEDSGVRHPHIITHLFADGGRILKTVKTSYADQIESATMGEVVQAMMKEQHKAMFMALRGGELDALFEDPVPSKPRAALPVPAPAEAAPMSAPPATFAPRERKASRPKIDLDPSTLLPPAQRDARGAGAVLSDAAPRREEAPGPATEVLDLPPPPDAVVRKKAVGSVSTLEPPPSARALPLDAPRSQAAPATSSRYAPSRPASIFAASGGHGEGASIFGEELISEKSLDEVILSYLAEDLESK